MVAPARVSRVMFSRWMSDSGVSRGTRMSGRRSLSATSAARSTRLRDVPAAMEAMVPMEHGQTTIPADGADPEAGVAPRSSESYSSTRLQSPVAARRPSTPSIPDSSASSRSPYPLTISRTGVPLSLSARSRRTAYGAPDAPVMPNVTGAPAATLTRAPARPAR